VLVAVASFVSALVGTQAFCRAPRNAAIVALVAGTSGLCTVSLMRKRSLIAVGLCAVWLPALAWYLGGGPDETPEQQVARQFANPDVTWARENLYLTIANDGRFRSPAPEEHVRGDRHTNTDRIKVLLVGDSFTYGWALSDPDARWFKQLEDELNSRTADGAFEVVVLARGGASTYTQAGWLERVRDHDAEGLQISDADMKRLSADFDVIVLGYVENDAIANRDDDFIPAGQFVENPYGEAGFYSQGEFENPNQEHFVRAVAAIKNFAGDRPIVWMPLDFFAGGAERGAKVRNIFEDAGFVIADARRTRSVERELPVEQLVADPVDSHPSPAVVRSYALDTADIVMGLLDANRLNRAIGGAAPVQRSVISNYMPTEMQLESNGTRFTLSYPGTPETTDRCVTLHSADRASVCDDGNWYFEVDGTSYPPQLVPCALIDAPYAYVGLNRHLRPGTSATIRVESDDVAKFSVYSLGYDDRMVRQISEVGVFERGESVAVTLGPSARGLLFAPAGRRGCPLELIQATALPPMRIVIDVASPVDSGAE
jgi:lysophospholipase L1-like esterase